MDKRVKEYIDGVMDGSIVVGKYAKLAVERHLNDLKEGPKRGLEFEEQAALHVIRFFEDFLHHSKGVWADDPFILEPWEAFILWVLFGWKRKATGARRFKMSYISVARKNGKSTLASGVGLYLMVADNEQGAEVYSAATKRDQAKIVWDEAKRMVQKSPHLREFVKTGMNTISVLRTNSKFEPLGKDSDTMDGLNISGAVIDELHAHKTREIFDILATSTGARRQPLLFVITTMVYAQESICAEQHAYSEAVLKGDVEDDSHFAYVATLDEGDDWHDEKSWVKANPNLGVTVEIEEMREQFKKAKESPAFEAAFRRLRLNEPVSPDVNKFLPMDKWDECQGSLDVKRPEEREQFIKDLEGKRCYAGLDLASTSDLAALVLIFPSEDKQTHKVLPYFWIPEENLKQRARKDRVHYPVWKNHGFIEATPGNVIDYNAIMVKLMGLKDRFDLRELIYDDWNSAKFIQDLQGLGFSDNNSRDPHKSSSNSCCRGG
jgi:phage terminase large subunit-like protein